ncbi:hypothetical protein SAMN02910400_01857 [Lachnospiraceae bacterium C10]|nr:hypothetical protein SAMN02910400_01857 [Lachnospiraceae bacterium C10]
MNLEELKREYEETLKNSYSLLDENSEWTDRYNGYITTISESFFPVQCKLVRKVVHINWPLAAYLNISSVTTSGMNMDLRLFGTSIATLFIKVDALTPEEYKLIRDGEIGQLDIKRINSVVNVSFKKKENAFKELIGEGSRRKSQVIKKEYVSKEYWDLEFINELLAGEEYGWHDNKIEKFRSIVKRIYDNQGFTAANEHAHESNVLHLMNGNSTYFHALKPVLLEEAFFQMPTPFKGSSSKDNIIKYASHNGGGIDILARKKYGAKNELCVIEIKDHYESGEEPIKAIKQAIAYSGFLMRLIQSKSGELWYKYFGINSSREKCNINAVIAMPYKLDKCSITKEDTAFGGMVLDAGDDCTITLNYLYYDERIFYSTEIDPDRMMCSIKKDR